MLEAAFRAGVAACDPGVLVPAALPPVPATGRVIVLAAGKAAGAMAAAVEAAWDRPIEGVVATRKGYERPLRQLETVFAGHPVPTVGSIAAAQRFLALAAGAGAGDLVLLLLSGGASAMLCAPPPALGLDGKIAVTRALLRSGEAIAAVNCVRRHLSAIKGGRLAAAAAPARIVALAISDVTDDAPHDIGSGPGVIDPTTAAQARAILDGCDVALPPGVLSESVKALTDASFRLIGGGAAALDAAARTLKASGWMPHIVATDATGEARAIAMEHAALARASRGRRVALLSGGELTVTVRGGGRGGPNQEYALALAQALAGEPGIHAIAGDTDGVDGTHDVAGAFVAPETLARLAAAGVDPAHALDDNDAGGAFSAIGDLLITGPTATNVNDLRIILIE